MDPKTRITSLHGTSVLEAAQFPLESNIGLSLLREPCGPNERALVNAAVGSQINLFGTPALAAAQAAREAGNAPNTVLAAACSILGPRHAEEARKAVRALVDRFAAAGLKSARNEAFDLTRVAFDGDVFVSDQPDPKAQALLEGLEARGAESVFVRYLRTLNGYPTADAVLAAVATTLAWEPLMRKRISRLTAETLPWWLRLFGVLIGASADAGQHEETAFCGIPNEEVVGSRTLGEVAFAALTGTQPSADGLFAFQTLVGLLLSNGPGTISAQGAKGAVSADGPETPERVQLNKALIGFLTHSGFAHGGNGYEGIAFLIEQFEGVDLTDPGNPDHGIDLSGLARRFAAEYATYKADRKTAGSLDIRKIPGVNHPVFKDKPVNHDPREVFVRELFGRRGEFNVFHAYYHEVVRALYETGVSRNVYCVNIDAVIAALLLKMLWRPYREGVLTREALETSAFTIFLYARMLGCAAEIDDHLNRGRNMDTRTAASKCRFVS